LGRIAGERGDFDAAWSQLDAAQQLFEQIGSQGGLLSVYTGRGRLRLYQGQPDEALPWLSQALKLALKQPGNAYRQSDIYRLLAQAGLQQRKLERAIAAANNALKLVEAAGNQEYIALAQATLAEIYAAQGNAAAAEAMYLRALALFEQVGHRAGRLRAQVSYARFLAKQGEPERAAALERAARQEAEQVGVALFLMTSA
jgi:tetratricopeptide (TPR) repeat protein